MVSSPDNQKYIGLTCDSRAVKPGYMFVAIPGRQADGRQFIADAIQRGASVIAVPKDTPKPQNADVIWVEVENPRAYLAEQAAKLYPRHPNFMTAVTGTNGKTSTVNFCRQLWAGMGIKGASLGTLGLLADGLEDYHGMTTPDAVVLHQSLQRLADHHVTHIAMEASSQGMDQDRLYGLSFQSIGFTNLTQDHLDYHGSMQNYLNAKLRLARELVVPTGTAILNADDTAHNAFADICRTRQVRVWTYGVHGREWKLKNRQAVPDGQILDLEVFGRAVQIRLPLIGLFQTMNVLCALGMVCAEEKESVDNVVAQAEKITGIPGRLQKVASPTTIGAYIDYAHTPDGLQNVLTAIRPHTTGRLICVFGCGGDRDRTKRPIMGRISSQIADITIVTDDNPRSENPDSIRAEIVAGTVGALSIQGRREAIRHAVAMMREGDVLVVAGKGHEQGQIFADHTDPFDDYTETETAIQSLLPSSLSA